MAKKINMSIFATIASLSLLQAGLYTILVLRHEIRGPVVSLFYWTNAILHATLFVFLIAQAEHFRTLPTGERLDRINIANKLTLFRLSSLVTIVFLLILVAEYPVISHLIVLTVVAFLTDLFDGQMARSANQITVIGKYLDSISDYASLIVISIAMHYFGLIPHWFFTIILVRLVVQWIGMGALLLYQGYVQVTSSFLGKASVFAIMTVFGFALLKLVTADERILTLIIVLEVIATGWIAASLMEKVALLVGYFREAIEVKKTAVTKPSIHGGPSIDKPCDGRDHL